MAETLIVSTESNTNPNGLSESPAPPSGGSLFHGRIEFHVAKKPFTGFSNGDGGFRLEALNPTSLDRQRLGGSDKGSGVSSLNGKKPDGSEFLDAGLDPELSFGITFRRIGAGLENLGNTCFLNSVLQCLTYTEPLAAYLQSGKHQNSCRKAGFCALCAFQKHVSRALQLTGRSIAPKDLVSNLRCISRNFRNSRQEDAHEYMVNLLESMHKCCLPAGVPCESPTAYEKSLVHKIFGGRLRSQVKCMQCSFCSNKFDPFLDLSLEIFKAESLHKAFMHFTTKEYLDGGERQYQCQQCKQKVKALKQLTIHKAPYVLTIHLKRFGTHQLGQKIDKKVQFGSSLDLKSFVSSPCVGELKYTLYGVIVHKGWSTHSGHYYCFVRTSSGMWYSLDDHQVRPVAEKTVLDQKAYMLFYVRDRRKLPQMKPIDVVQNERLAINGVGNKAHSNLYQGSKETGQHSLINERVNGVDSSAAEIRRDAIVAAPFHGILMKEASVQKSSTLNVAGGSPLKKDPLLDPSCKVPDLMGSVNGLSVLHPSGREQSMQPSPIESFGEALNKDAFAISGPKINECSKERSAKDDSPFNSVTKKDSTVVLAKTPEDNQDRSTRKDLRVSFAMTPNCNGHHSSAGDLCITDQISQREYVDKVSDKIDPRPLDQLNRENSLTGGLSSENALGDSDRVKGVIESKLSGPETANISLHQGAIDHNPKQKLKKGLTKCQDTRMYLGSSMLFRTSLGLWKKKHKRIKHAVKIRDPMQKHLLEEEYSLTDLGPSTSERTRTLSIAGTVHSRVKGLKSTPIKKDGRVIYDGYGDRLLQQGAVLATDKQPERSCSPPLAGNRCDTRGATDSKVCRRDPVQNDLMSMLTRGLEETTVARWDGIGLSSQITESTGMESLTIGYVADEWDEEYDRGKRKKVRNLKNEFGRRPNPFQEIATRKLKKARNDQSSSGNQPFRI